MARELSSTGAGGSSGDDEGWATDCLDEQTIIDYLAASLPQTAAAEVRGHIETCAACRTVLAESARASSFTPTPSSGARAALRTMADGEIILGRYEIVTFIARGGMGEVYQARDLVLGETVALKTLVCTGLDDDDAVPRFKAEVQLARKVSHTNVCRILEFGLHERELPRGGVEQLPFLTMEFLEGQTLRQLLSRSSPLDGATARGLFLQLVDGLAAIHAAGIVHRDLKSDNVFLEGPPSEAGSNGRLVVMDFGLARPATLDQVRTFSNHSALAGTTAYMAPEQFQGRPASLATDIYSLGVVMFEAVTGSLPFMAETPIATALKKLQSRPPRPSTLAPQVDRVLDNLIVSCLEPDARRRVKNLTLVRAALESRHTSARRRGWHLGLAVAALTTIPLGAYLLSARGPWETRSLPPLSGPAPSAPGRLADTKEAAAPAGVGAGRAKHADEFYGAQATQTLAPSEIGSAAPGTPRIPPRRPAPERTHRGRQPAPADPGAVAPPSPETPAGSARDQSGLAEAMRDAQALMTAGKAGQACGLLEDARTRFPDEPTVYRALGKCYMRIGNVEAAKESYRGYLDRAPDAADAVFIKGIVR